MGTKRRKPVRLPPLSQKAKVSGLTRGGDVSFPRHRAAKPETLATMTTEQGLGVMATHSPAVKAAKRKAARRKAGGPGTGAGKWFDLKKRRKK